MRSAEQKTGRSLTGGVIDALQSLPRISSRVFTHKGRSITYGSAWWNIAKACRLAGIGHTGWHPLRHTFATELCARGAHLKVVSDLLGHTNITMTQRYTHRVSSAMRQAVALLDGNRQTFLGNPWATEARMQTSPDATAHSRYAELSLE